MKIHVNRVPAEGLTEHATYDPMPLDMDRADVHLSEPFEVDARIVKADRELVVKVDIHAPVSMTCARCLTPFSSKITAATMFSYPVHPTDVVDITDDVRQEIILAYPMIPVCRPQCKGLCMVCGQNLNVASCDHASRESA
jgi:uncharacterized protein